MYNLWQCLKEHGIRFVKAREHRLSALDCVELLLVNPAHSEWIPFECLTPEAWLCLIKSCYSNDNLKGVFAEHFAPHLPWEIISKKMRRLIQRDYPEIDIPDVRPEAQIEDVQQIIYTSPFKKTIFSILPPGETEPLVGCLKIYGVIASLRGSYNGDYLTCGCGEPGCSGFDEINIHPSPQMIRISLMQYEKTYDLFFDRETYERGAIQLLQSLIQSHWNGSESYNQSYDGFLSFAKSVIELFEEKPHLLTYWQGVPPHYLSLLFNDAIEEKNINHLIFSCGIDDYPVIHDFGGGFDASVAAIYPKFVTYASYLKQKPKDLTYSTPLTMDELRAIIHQIPEVDYFTSPMLCDLLKKSIVAHVAESPSTKERYVWCLIPNHAVCRNRDKIHSSLLITLDSSHRVKRYTLLSGYTQEKDKQYNLECSEKKCRTFKVLEQSIQRAKVDEFFIVSSKKYPEFFQGAQEENGMWTLEWQVHSISWHFRSTTLLPLHRVLELLNAYLNDGMIALQTMETWEKVSFEKDNNEANASPEA